ncbi:MAG: hypothetical protein ACKVS8_02415 [Phycisphaerales bacterium]
MAATLVVAGVVGLLACGLAVPLAWVAAQALAARTRSLALAALALPLLQPGYLWYAGVSAARGPGTWLGGIIERGPQWVNIGIGQSLAVVGVAVSIMPIAGVLLVAGFGTLPRSTLETLRLEPCGPLVRWWLMVRLTWRSLAGAAALGALVALGSAVPLHLAQVDTYAIGLWRMMDLAGPSTSAAVVWAATPLVLVAVVAAWVLSGRLLNAGDAGGDVDASPAGVGANALAAAWVVGLGATVLPAGLLAASLRESALLAQFWRDSGAAVAQSLFVASAVGAVCGLTTAGVWLLLSSVPVRGSTRGARRGVLARGVLTLGLACALLPGVLVGWLIRLGATKIGAWWLGVDDFVSGTSAGLVLGHSARFAGLAMVIGVLLARAEPRGLKELRASEGAAGFAAWWRLCLLPGWKPLAGAGLAAMSLSMFEIEASVMLQAPGTGSLARTLLEHLHTLRDQQLAAGAVNLMAIGLVLAAVSGWLVGPLVARGAEW